MNQTDINDIFDLCAAIRNICDDVDFDAQDPYDVKKDAEAIRAKVGTIETILWTMTRGLSSDD